MQNAGKSIFVGGNHFTEGKGGIAVVARLTVKALQAMGNDLRIVSLLDGDDGTLHGVPWRTVRANRLKFLARCHAGALVSDTCLYDSVSTARAHPRLPFVSPRYGIWMHGIEVWYNLQKDRERALRRADLVLVNSQTTLDKFCQIHGDLPSARVCWLSTEDDTTPNLLPSFEGPPSMLALGTVDLSSFYKGHNELIGAWPAVVAAQPKARLVFAGGGNGLDHLRDLVRASAARDNIDVLGYVRQADLPALWQSAHAFALPSRNEGFGLVYAEAMRHHLPVIASVHDAGREVNADAVTGYNVDLDSKDELADRLIALLTSPDLAQRLGRQGHERWQQHFRFSEFQKRFETITSHFL